MNSENYQSGDEVDIDGTVITLGARRGNNGVRWTWVDRSTEQTAGLYLATAGEAVTHARKTLGRPACRHGQHGWCPTCHDQEGR